MLIGVPKEIKNNEYRAGMTPESVSEAIKHGHKIIIETNLGAGIGVKDEEYQSVGAEIVKNASDIFERADMIVKVKEPQAIERSMLRKNQILYTYLHLAPDPQQTKDLVDSGAICFAYETITDNQGGLPLLKPMSQVAGRLSIQAGAKALEKSSGGLGSLLGGVPGVTPANILIIGGGVVGYNAAQMAVGLQADVTILDNNPNTLERLNSYFGASAKVIHSNKPTLEQKVAEADLVIGGVLIAGAAAPKLVNRDMLETMKSGAVLVDVAIDQGGCFETSKATTHSEPTYIVDEIVHYCVANMPGAVPRTSTYALNIATLPYLLTIANKGWKRAAKENQHLANGLNVVDGKVVHEVIAKELGYNHVAVQSIL